MSDRNSIVRAVPTLTINNRRKNLQFYTEVLGLTNVLEDAGYTILGDQSRQEKLLLEEVPSNRARKVQGLKKLAKVVLKVKEPREIDSLLARAPEEITCYKGENGLAFEATSPEGDRFLLHSEDDVTTLIPVAELEQLHPLEHVEKLSEFEVEKIHLHISSLDKEDFYQKLPGSACFLDFVEVEGTDLEIEAGKTWDLSAIRWKVEEIDVAQLEHQFSDTEVFVPKSRKFFGTKDKSQIEVWVERV
ncbi:CppA N-terminal domain-containing protein [Streptococcus himalayensis]|uniref:Proteinase n=1 Tax=Streptococcus himalayensis TaxID=1888195 RepID=A0A917EFP4_9STRE|nr:CppA N-terminal domain-containing protein [Streptococcus himalayensis]GGE35474.1 proteinase [Streptococcus himalayensis]